jgi:pyridinium-3,5-biscarboxylic acid mononucleotide sulfurtransferase
MDVDGLGRALEDRIHGLGTVIVAYSGGADSTVVAAAAMRALGDHALAVTAVSPALASGELESARNVAAEIGIAHEAVATDELARPGYAANGTDRCYHCKDVLYTALWRLAADRGFAALVSGANVDDLGDWRPGLRAAEERGVVHPLVDVGATKADVRRLARRLGLTNADKVASPCLASRVPYGRRIDPEMLHRIDRAEAAVRELGFRIFRVRDLGDFARLEVAQDELARALRSDIRAMLVDTIRAEGYERVEVADTPFCSGSLNRGLVSLPIVGRSAID